MRNKENPNNNGWEDEGGGAFPAVPDVVLLCASAESKGSRGRGRRRAGWGLGVTEAPETYSRGTCASGQYGNGNEHEVTSGSKSERFTVIYIAIAHIILRGILMRFLPLVFQKFCIPSAVPGKKEDVETRPRIPSHGALSGI
jgi:hypothetical protein